MSPLVSLLVGLFAIFLFLSGAAVGAAVLGLIGRLTGGAWREAPGLLRLRALVPLALIPALLCRAALSFVLPAASGPAALYLSPPLLIARLVLAGAVWIWIGRPGSSKLSAAIALAAHGLVVSVMAVDLITSLEPGWLSTAEGTALAVRQLGTALAAALLLGVAKGDDRVRRDLTGLLVATLLGTLYLNLMSYLVPWYGDLADKTGWIRLRDGMGWRLLIGAALGGGGLLPLALIGAGERFGPLALRIAAGLALLGFLGQTIWLVAPGFGGLAMMVTAVLALIGAGLALVGPVGRLAHAR